MVQVAHGRLSKQIAGDIGIAEATVKDASQPSAAPDEGPFASRAKPNGGQAQTTSTRGAVWPASRDGGADREDRKGRFRCGL